MTKIDAWIDKSEWGPGPWQHEPDRVEWRDEATGYPCIVLRANERSGNWCGYVAVSPGHPAYEKGYDDIDVDVHGGLTFGAAMCSLDKERGVCHVPESGESDDVHWFGFDYAPAMVAWERREMPDLEAKYRHLRDRDVYRDIDYVRAECARLAEQLKAMK